LGVDDQNIFIQDKGFELGKFDPELELTIKCNK